VSTDGRPHGFVAYDLNCVPCETDRTLLEEGGKLHEGVENP